MYCTLENIKELLPTSVLGQLVSNDLQVERAIKSATTTINAYLAGAYPPDVESDFLKEICQKIALYTLYMLVASDETPEIVKTAYRDAISDLEKLQKGTISLPGAEKQNPCIRQAEVFCNKTPEDKLF